ncbi:MAG: antitoxin [Propionibacteriaceae bacterium]|jgi:antitoxin VapB|nr:antitoxin [Propionibacteriaceae bacterium]
MTTGTVFLNNTTQAVRLPKSVAWPPSVSEVTIQVVGDQRIMTPAGGAWSAWFDTHIPVSSDFMRDRDQPEADERAAL